MRASVLYGLTAAWPAVLAQEINTLEPGEVASDAAVEQLEGFTNQKLVASADDDDDDDPVLSGAEINLEFSETRKYDVSEVGHLIMPRNGRRYGLYPDHYLKSIKIDEGPCTLVYQNTSELSPPPPEGFKMFNKTQEMKFDADGGEFDFQEVHFKKTMRYIYCGDTDAGEDDEDDDEEIACKDVIKGGSAVDKGQICCLPPTEWRDELWDLMDMDTYLRDALDHFNEKGWQTNVMNTFSTYDLEVYRKVTELGEDDKGRERPFWEWNCGGINSNLCFSKDLSDWNACRVDPRRRLLLQAMENFSNRWQTAQTQFSQDALTQIVMTLPNLTKTLFPLEGDKPGFDAPGDYKDSTWIMIAGSITGVLGLPFSYGGPKTVPSMPKLPTHGAVLSGALSAVMFLVGLGMAPTLEEPFVEEDPHFEKFGDFSEDVGRNFVEWIYKGYANVYDNYFHTPSGEDPPENVDADALGDLLSEGKMIRPWSALPKDVDNEMQDKMTNRFLSPMVNLAYQRNKIFLIKLPAGGLEFWQHEKKDKTETKRTSAIWDPCGDWGGDYGIHPVFETADPKDKERAIWHPYGAENRAVCNEDGSSIVFFAWSDHTETAFTDFGWTEMENRGLMMKDVVDQSISSQDANGWFGMPSTLEQRVGDMAEAAGSAIEDPTTWDFWNLAICDMTDMNDEGPNLVRVEDCDEYDLEPGASGGARIGPSCIKYGIRDRCSQQQDKNGDNFPYQLEEEGDE